MKRKKLISLSLTLALSFGLCITASAEGEEEETPKEEAYYVCFSYDNYQVKNTNKMTGVDKDSDGSVDYYELSSKSLSSTTEFYVINQDEEKFYASDGANMKVEDGDSYKYNIFFMKDYVYDEEKVSEADVDGTDLYVSNAHISYDYYIPGNYSLDVNGNVNADFKYNHYITSYDAYILPEVSLKKGDVITVTDNDTSGDDLLTYTKTIENDGNYRITFTPTSTKNSDEYRFDADGNYGSGDEYTENFSISDVEYYYIAFDSDTSLTIADKTSYTFTCDDKSVTAYRLIKDETKPLSSVFLGESFFNNKKNHKVSYRIYHYSYIFDSYEMIDDDNDSDTTSSEFRVSSVSWYEPSLSVAEGSYTVAFTQDSVDFGGYYIVGEFNNFGYTATGELNLEDKYKFREVTEDDADYYDKDNKQFINEGFAIAPEDLDEDDDDYEFVISNGKTKTSTITIKTPGTYDILYSTEKTYNDSSYKYVRTADSENLYKTCEISSKEVFLKYIDEWNLDSQASKYVIYNITADIDFKNTEVPSVSVFNGTINGNGHVLSNLTFSDEDGREDIGLFKLVTKYASISNLTIDNLSITAEDSSYVGFIARNYGFISDITVSGSVTGKSYVGGIAGYNGNYTQDSDTTADSSVKYGYGVLKNAEGSVTVYGEINVGGLAGFNGGKIISSKNAAKINDRSYASSVTVTNIGGIAGYSTGEIVDCVNEGVVGHNGTGDNVGGIAGLLNGEVYFSANTANVYGKSNVGGICGYFGSASTDSDSRSQAVSSLSDTSSVVDQIMGTDSDTPAYEEEDDISNHCIYYSYSTGNVHGVRYAGGLLGYNNSNALVLKNCIIESDIYADSGSYAGGLAGYLNGGTLTSNSYSGYIEANGSVNRYVGGIAGYSSGKIEACTANATLSGGEYVGGIAGYVTSDGYVLSSYANVYMITESTNQYTGNIAGYIDGMDNASGTYGDRVKYNYYMGSDLKDYSGINGINYGKSSHYAAERITYSSLLKNDLLSQTSKKFGLMDEDDDTYYYKKGNPLPLLLGFIEVDELDDDSFDDDTNSYDSYSSYFDKYADIYLEMEKDCARCVCRTIFKEWDPELDDNKIDNYVVVAILERTLGETDAVTAPSFKYVEEEDASTSLRNDALYRVSWETISSDYKNQTVYAQYEEIRNSLYDSNTDVFAEGEFTKEDELKVTKEHNVYKITITEDGVEKEFLNLTVKIYCDKPERCYVMVNGRKVDSVVYGSYLEFTLPSTSDEFAVKDGGFRLSLLPDYVIALAIIIPVLLILVVLIVISNVRTRRKDKNTSESENTKSQNPSGTPEIGKEEKASSVPAEEPKPAEVLPEGKKEPQSSDASDNASASSDDAAKPKETSQAEPKKVLTPEERKQKQMENLRKARLAREANLKKQHPQE